MAGEGLGIQVQFRQKNNDREIWFNRGRYYPINHLDSLSELLIHPVLDITAIGQETLGLTRSGSHRIREIKWYM